jgi:hypothetical protein
MRNVAPGVGLSPKFITKWLGPYLVVSRKFTVTYILEILDKSKTFVALVSNFTPLPHTVLFPPPQTVNLPTITGEVATSGELNTAAAQHFEHRFYLRPLPGPNQY